MSWLNRTKNTIVDSSDALPGRDVPMPVPDRHTVLGTPLTGPWPPGIELAYFGLGCFWGAERIFWKLPGVYTTAVGYQGGTTPNPTYRETCSGATGHTEAVLVAFDPTVVSYADLVHRFFESHDPTQGMRQGNDRGSQYRSAVYWTSVEQRDVAIATRDVYQVELGRSGYGPITTEIASAGPFYYAEDYHQQYLDKNPGGYCGIGGTGVSCPIGVATA